MVRWIAFAMVLAASCGRPPPTLTVTLANASFATNGGNLFNCTAPQNAPTPRSLNTSGITCNPTRNADGSFSTTPVTVFYQLGCGDGHEALIVVTCGAATDGGIAGVGGSVALGINPDCNTPKTTPGNAQQLAFSDLEPGATASLGLSACDAFENLCNPSNACAFNTFAATVTVTNAVAHP